MAVAHLVLGIIYAGSYSNVRVGNNCFEIKDAETCHTSIHSLEGSESLNSRCCTLDGSDQALNLLCAPEDWIKTGGSLPTLDPQAIECRDDTTTTTPTNSTTPPPETTGPECFDVPKNWKDDYGFTCHQYEKHGWCKGFGDLLTDYEGRKASHACCACKGGSTGENPFTYATTRTEGSTTTTEPVYDHGWCTDKKDWQLVVVADKEGNSREAGEAFQTRVVNNRTELTIGGNIASEMFETVVFRGRNVTRRIGRGPELELLFAVDCDWFSAFPAELCSNPNLALINGSYNLNAMTACCACGGGRTIVPEREIFCVWNSFLRMTGSLNETERVTEIVGFTMPEAACWGWFIMLWIVVAGLSILLLWGIINRIRFWRVRMKKRWREGLPERSALEVRKELEAERAKHEAKLKAEREKVKEEDKTAKVEMLAKRDEKMKQAREAQLDIWKARQEKANKEERERRRKVKEEQAAEAAEAEALFNHEQSQKQNQQQNYTPSSTTITTTTTTTGYEHTHSHPSHHPPHHHSHPPNQHSHRVHPTPQTQTHTQQQQQHTVTYQNGANTSYPSQPPSSQYYPAQSQQYPGYQYPNPHPSYQNSQRVHPYPQPHPPQYTQTQHNGNASYTAEQSNYY